jgi:hypothetical protein
VAFSPSGDAIAVAHGTSPYISVYPWSNGFGTKYANPGTLPNGTGYGVAFSPSGNAIAVAHLNSPYVSAYPWSSGFGTKYANPGTLPNGTGYGVAFSPTPTLPFGSPASVSLTGLSPSLATLLTAGTPGSISLSGLAPSLAQALAAGSPATVSLSGLAPRIAPFDVVVETRISSLTGSAEAGVVARLQDTSNFIAAYVDRGDSLVHLALFAAGVETTVATAAWAPSATAEVRMICQGERVRVWVDRVLRIDATVSQLITLDRAGLFARGSTATRFDDFYAQAL